MPGDNNVGFALRYKFSIKINSVEFEDGFTRSDGKIIYLIVRREKLHGMVQ